MIEPSVFLAVFPYAFIASFPIAGIALVTKWVLDDRKKSARVYPAKARGGQIKSLDNSSRQSA